MWKPEQWYRPFCLFAVLAVGLRAWAAGAEETAAEKPSVIQAPADVLGAVYLVPNANLPNLELRLIVQRGEIDNPGTIGLAHYVEHISWQNAFHGDRRGDDAAKYGSNATTNAIATSYYSFVSREDLAQGISLLLRVLEPITIAPEFLRQERDIVRQEYDLRYGGTSSRSVWDELRRRLYGKDPRSRSVMGSPADIQSFTLKEALALRAKTHVPSKAVLVVYGNVSADQILESLAKVKPAFRNIKSQAVAAGLPFTVMPDARDIQKITEQRFTSPQLFYTRLFPLPSCRSNAAQLDAELDIVSSVLSSAFEGGLAKPLRFDDPIAQYFDVEFYSVNDCYAAFFFDAEPDADVTLDRLLETLEDNLNRIATVGIPPATFEAVYKKYIRELDLSDDPQADVFSRTLDLVARRLPPETPSEYADAVAQVTLGEANALLKSLMWPGRVVGILASPGASRKGK